MARRSITRCLRFVVPGALCLALVAGCASKRPPIDRVQPYALKKALFVGEDLQDPADNPEFYALATLVDVGGYGASQDGLFTSTWAQSTVRVKWHITENMLLGRLAYERIDGADGKGVGNAVHDGTVVMAFKILKHFDIVHAYNPTTGEKLNILEENMTDRPWFEREYMRVDWSKNVVTDAYDFDTLSLIGAVFNVTYEPIAYDVTDPDDPDAPVFDLENGYFDITNKAFAKPGVVDLSAYGWGLAGIPACWLDNDFMSGTAPSGSCNPVELTMRFSFRRVDEEKNDYEAGHWDGYRFQAAGAFTSERFGFARNYGMTDALRHRFINRMNIWKRSHHYANPENMTGQVECFTPATTPFGADPHRDLDGNGTHDECEAVGNGSRCNIYKQRCTLPYRLREPKVTPWYVTDASDQKYVESSKQALHEWDVSLRIAVRAAQYAECKALNSPGCEQDYPVLRGQVQEHVDLVQLAWEVDTCREGRAHGGQNCEAVADQVGGERGLGAEVISIAKMPEMMVLCNSPVQHDDPEACGGPRLPQGITAQMCQDANENGDRELRATCKQAKSVRLGDLRHHIVNLIKDPQTPSAWGIWTGAVDPLTGEIVSNCVNVWTFINDLYTQIVMDTVRYIAGELTTEDVTEGEWVRAWSQAAQSAAGGGVTPRMTKKQVDSRVGQFAGLTALQSENIGQWGANLPDSLRQEVRRIKYELSGVMGSVKAASVSQPVYAARRSAVAGTAFEAQLMTPMMQQYYGVQGMPITESTMDRVSPLRGGNPSVERDLAQLREVALGDRAACILHADTSSLAPVSVAPLGKELQAKFGNFNPDDDFGDQQERAERMHTYLSGRVNYGVIIHELGHAMGHRHNFVSSSFAYGYRPQYWQLRTKNGTVATECTDLSATGEDCVGPRWFDPVTPNEQDNLIWMWMHSSVMDYPGEFTQNLVGLGIWDHAATRLFYGDVASVANPPTPLTTPVKQMMSRLMDNFGGITGYQYTLQNVDLHYSQLQGPLKLIGNCRTVDPESRKPAAWNQERDGNFSPALDGLLVSVNGQHSVCDEMAVDYVRWDDLRYPTTSELGVSWYRGGPAIDPEGRVRMPYGFGTDSWADVGNLSVYRHDNGADAYEIFNFMLTQQEINHIFDNYRRGRAAFSVRSAAGRTLSRFNMKMRDGAKGLSLYRTLYEDFALDSGYNGDDLWPFIANDAFRDNIIASAMVFDHFTRQMARPQAGEHFYIPNDAPVLRSVDDSWATQPTRVVIPDGATGYYGDISLGGKLVENRLCEECGEYRTDYTMNVGQYYDKLYSTMLMTESVDRFISASRTDYVDPRYRAVSLADLFPEGYRRWLANNLTGDEHLKGARVSANAAGDPLLEAEGYPADPIGYITWWTEQPEVCFPNRGTMVCSVPGANAGSVDPLQPEHTAVLDPQVGWEQQKFLIAWTMLYLPENQKMNWLDLMRIWEYGRDAEPNIGNNRIELHNPTGRTYVAKTFGTEEIFGQTVQRGVAARILEYANWLLAQAYEVIDGPDLNGDGVPDWYVPVYNSATGQPIVKWDPTIAALNEQGQLVPGGVPGCDVNDSSECTCAANRACIKFQRYVSVPAYLREAISAYNLGSPEQRGIYD